MKYYSQLNLDGKPYFDVVWGEPLKEDETLVAFKRGNTWNILDIISGLTIGRSMKSKKAILEWYNDQIYTNSLGMRIDKARLGDRYKAKVEAMQNHRILHVGDRVTYINVKDSVILDLLEYNVVRDCWIVQDEWHEFEVSPDRIIKLSEVNQLCQLSKITFKKKS